MLWSVPGDPRARTTSENASIDSTRRSAVLETAASLIATSGLRTSMHEIADAAGIQPGSLYHHFDSKEALLVELLRRYHRDLDRIAEQALAALDDPDARPGSGRSPRWGRRWPGAPSPIAPQSRSRCMKPQRQRRTHRVDPPASDGGARRRVPDAAGGAMGGIDRIGDRPARAGGPHLPEHAAGRPRRRPAQRTGRGCRDAVLPDHLRRARRRPASDADLDRSAAFLAANDAIAGWTDDTEPDDRVAHIRAVARSEFGRRGYEGTTIRDIAAAAGMGHGTVFRHIGSKEELLASIMGGFGEKVEACAKRVLRAQSTPVEKLDALGWVNINALQRFGDEFRIQLAWMRQIPGRRKPQCRVPHPAQADQSPSRSRHQVG